MENVFQVCTRIFPAFSHSSPKISEETCYATVGGDRRNSESGEADAAKADEWSTKLEAMKKPIPTMDIYLMKTS